MSRISRRSILVSSAAVLAALGVGGRHAWSQGASPTITVYRNPS
jgi:hypothetical protein